MIHHPVYHMLPVYTNLLQPFRGFPCLLPEFAVSNGTVSYFPAASIFHSQCFAVGPIPPNLFWVQHTVQSLASPGAWTIGWPTDRDRNCDRATSSLSHFEDSCPQSIILTRAFQNTYYHLIYIASSIIRTPCDRTRHTCQNAYPGDGR